MKSLSLLIPLLASACVSAHGIINSIVHNGRTIRTSDTRNTPVRRVNNPNPNLRASNPALLCGPNSQKAAVNLAVNPGDELGFGWGGIDGSRWPHNTGPMITYMANCGNVLCSDFDISQARWFKIDEVGRKGNSGTWFQQDLMNGAVAKVRLPSNLAAGNYLIRHEIIALHLATRINGAEFYPGCAQLRVGGTQTGKPTGELVRFPGAYQDSDPGIFAPNVFNAGARYIFPGPPVARLTSSGGNDGGNNGSATTSAKPTSTKTASSTPVSKPTGNCRLKRRQPVDADSEADNEEVVVRRPRHISRVMRRAGFESNMH